MQNSIFVFEYCHRENVSRGQAGEKGEVLMVQGVDTTLHITHPNPTVDGFQAGDQRRVADDDVAVPVVTPKLFRQPEVGGSQRIWKMHMECAEGRLTVRFRTPGICIRKPSECHATIYRSVLHTPTEAQVGSQNGAWSSRI